MSKEKLVGIVCHDAGGAEIVSSYVVRNNLAAGYYLKGPAISIFEGKLGIIKNSDSLFDLVKKSDWLLCGTSWQSELEWGLIQEAKKQGKKVISFLDHWGNYQERFTRKKHDQNFPLNAIKYCLKEAKISSDDLEIVNSIQYLVVAGDVVDGIGVYPGQEEELTSLNFTKQYDEFAELLKEIPNHIRVFISPGNHDATRHALPQPPIFKKYAASLYDMNNVEMLGDPCYIRLHGVNILVYHGQSLPDIIGSTPGISFDSPADAMKVLLRARHLAPTHGSGTTVALEEDDRLVIDDVP